MMQHALEVAGDKSEVERLATQVRQDKSSVEQMVQQKLIMQEQTFSRVSTATLQRALKHPDMRRLYMRLRIKLQSARIM